MSSTVLVILLLVAAGIAIYLWVRLPALMEGRTGRLFLLGTLLVMPLLLVQFGVSHSLSASKEKKFCTSCHEMEVYDTSLHIDDSEYIPAVHAQNRLVPKDTPCYTCHTDYTLYGDISAKWNGLHHVLVHYFGDIPPAGEIKLYKPFPNDNCLQCHRGSRRFERKGPHITEGVTLDLLYSNQKSCLSKGCHDKAHEIKKLGGQELYGEVPFPVPQELIDAAKKEGAGAAEDPFGAEDPFANESPDAGTAPDAGDKPANEIKNVDDLWGDEADASPSPSDAEAPSDPDAAPAVESPDTTTAPAPDATPATPQNPQKEDAR